MNTYSAPAADPLRAEYAPRARGSELVHRHELRGRPGSHHRQGRAHLVGEHRRLQASVDVAPAALARLFAVQPASWLRDFLHLAILASTRKAASAPPAPPWYRLGAPLPDGSGGLTTSFVWCPHASDDLFARFAGRFAVAPAPGGATLVLEGDTTGGAEHRNTAVLQMLVDLISSAISADPATSD